jgi:hypothetical protein
MSKRPYDLRDPYEAIRKITADFKALADSLPKLSALERMSLELQMGGTVRYRMDDEVHAVRLVDGRVTFVDDVREGA